ncbi:MAG: hypothetical protein ABSG96_20355 [Terracidiphilus sp.]
MIRRSPASGNPELALDATPIVSFFEGLTGRRGVAEDGAGYSEAKRR